MVTFLSFGQQNLIIVNNDVTTIATQCYRFCDFVDFSFLPFIILWWLSNRWKKAIMVFLQNEATRSTPSLPPPPPGRDTSSSRSYLQAVSSIFPDNSPLTLLLQGEERYCESLVPWTRTQSSTTHVAFQLGSDKNNSQKSFLLFLGKAIISLNIILKSLNSYEYSKYFFIKINSSSVNP